MFGQFKNPDGTYNGAKALSAASGLPEGEILWTFNRLKHLMTADGKSKDEAKAIVREEAKCKPWEQRK